MSNSNKSKVVDSMKIDTVKIENNRASLSLTCAFDDQNGQTGLTNSIEDSVNERSVGRLEGLQTNILELFSSSCPGLTIKENHFSSPEFLGKTSKISLLETSIEDYKIQIKNCASRLEKSKLVRKLIELRYELLNLKEEPLELEHGSKAVMGHVFEEKPWGRAKGYCEKCCAVIVGIFQSWYKCKTCSFCCHKKCAIDITRVCPSAKILKDPTFKLEICPEVGLHAQHYACYECKAPIGFRPGTDEARQCDYNGFFYCNKCHWNDSMVIPARVIANWDFEPRKVCRATKSFLRLMDRKAVFNIQVLNPWLFTYIDELNEIKRKREEILLMKRYFLECPKALKEKLLLQLQHRQHFVENSEMYSLQDLIDTSQDVLLPEITKIQTVFARHIKNECESCKNSGGVCCLCESKDLLFPFNSDVHCCTSCSAIMHLHCFQLRNQKCPKCFNLQGSPVEDRNFITT